VRERQHLAGPDQGTAADGVHPQRAPVSDQVHVRSDPRCGQAPAPPSKVARRHLPDHLGQDVRGGALVRTCEVLTFPHTADGAGTLLEAAAAYERLARAADAMAAAGGRLVSADDGFLHVDYDRSVP
jgi:hypothetical protein